MRANLLAHANKPGIAGFGYRVVAVRQRGRETSERNRGVRVRCGAGKALRGHEHFFRRTEIKAGDARCGRVLAFDSAMATFTQSHIRIGKPASIAIRPGAMGHCRPHSIGTVVVEIGERPFDYLVLSARELI
jgi:hypothetical protein